MTLPPLTPDDEVIETASPCFGDSIDPVDATESTDRRTRRIGWTIGHPDGIVTGLAAHLADRLAVDPLWVRLAFVVTGLLGGLGVFLYVGLWLALIVARSAALRLVGAAIAIGGFLALAQSDLSFMTGPVAVIGLLIGLALTLWKPVPDWVGEQAGEASVDEGATIPVQRVGRAQTHEFPVVRAPQPHRPPSLLGQATLGLATIGASSGALIDQLNGGRLHPEQWLGAAAIVCGLGLLVGTVRGHARWLLVPAIVFAGVGYGAGLMARIDVGPGDAFGGNRYVWVGDGSTGPYEATGGLDGPYISIEEAPSEQVAVDVRTAAGVDISTNPEVAVEIRSRLGDVTMRRDGVQTTASTFRLGPDGTPDVVIDLRMVRGQIEVVDAARVVEDPQFFDETLPVIPALPQRGGSNGATIDPIVEVADGINVTSDGWIILDGEAIIDEAGNMISGSFYASDDVVLIIETQRGEYRIVGPVLFTPDGAYFDLDELRQRARLESEVPPASVGVQVAESGDPAPLPTVPPPINTTVTTSPASNDSNGAEG